MKKTYLTLLAIVVGIGMLILSSCKLGCEHGSGHQSTETRKVADFTKIDVSGEFKVNIKQDSSLALNITTDDNLMKYIKTKVSNNKLYISTKDRNICTNGPIAITIGVRNLSEIASAGGVEIVSQGKLVTKDFHFDLSGATKINMELDAANVSTEGSGATEISLKGQASSHTIDLSGGSKVYAFDFIVGNYNIDLSGASDCEINVLHSLNVSSSGASSIKYKGNPSSIHNDKSGISSITKVN
jgi:hypothetical protein